MREALIRNGRLHLLDGIEPMDVRESGRESADDAISNATPTKEAADRASSRTPERSGPPRPLGVVMAAATVLCLAAAFLHVLLVFLYVAPPNTISQRYSSQIYGWVEPLFQQNWKLFAPNPESVNRQILARTMQTAPDGTEQVSDWFDLTAVDASAIEHNLFPSHTAQNMLRVAWSNYLDWHGSDDRSHSQRALMMKEYLRNIAVDRVAAQRHSTFEAIQLQVITRPIAASAAADSAERTARPPIDTRYLPWWKAGAHEN
ncbi:hypothetical protein GCM10009609_05230 [Pseudonocardia aurantiaca]|uniref:DUF5819 family protein n=1 Tax=Pseudonocardia aurantiaca TaxID=75290 RepID=A0ABW4FJM1_9PSEU